MHYIQYSTSIMQHIQRKLKVKVKISIEKQCVLSLIRHLLYFHPSVGIICMLGSLEHLITQHPLSTPYCRLQVLIFCQPNSLWLFYFIHNSDYRKEYTNEVTKWRPQGRRKRGRPKLTWGEGNKGLMGEKGLMDEDWNYRSNWKKKII
jgi:hypothetical protein